MRLFTLFIILLFLVSAAVAQSVGEDATPVNLQAKVQLFPNPAIDYLHVRLENNVEITNLRIALHNIIGNEIPVEIEYIGSDELRIRVKDFSVGYYLLALHDEGTNYKGTYKFLKR